jgi:prophage tail gpP-like protein
MQRLKECAVWVAIGLILGGVLLSGWLIYDIVRDFVNAVSK